MSRIPPNEIYCMDIKCLEHVFRVGEYCERHRKINMGCSDRYDLDYCEYKLTHFNSGAEYRCNKRTDGGIYCKEHTKNVLPKEDAAEVIAKLKAKKLEKKPVYDWLKE